MTDPISQLVYSTGAKSVHTVLIDGRGVLEGRLPTRVEPRAVLAGVQASVRRVFDRMGYCFEPKWKPLNRP